MFSSYKIMLPNYNFVNLPQGSLRPPSDVMMPSRPSTVLKTLYADNMSRSGISGGNDNWYYTSNSSVEMELRMRRTEETIRNLEVRTRNLEVNVSHMTWEFTHAMRNLTQHIS